MKALTLAKGLQLPVAAVTESIGILAKRRAGKSTTARRLAEQLHRAGQQVVIADPKGDWWGLRFARDGQRPGLPFVVLGGEHGDVPLEVGAGELVARLVVEQRVSVILDLSRFRKGEVARFMTAFMETLYRLKAQERYRTPVMLIIDEADAIAPQKPFGDEARMVGAASDLVRRGGQRGIGVTMITQRSAVLNKDLLTQISILIVLQTIAPQDQKAIDAWIDVHGEPAQRQQLMASLASLARGEGWVWAPGWPTEIGIFARVAFLLPETFDSSKTPEAGARLVEPTNAAAVDLDAFRQEMAATLEKAKAEDPRELRKRIAELERQVKAAAATTPTVQRVEVPVIPEAVREQARAIDAAVQQLALTLTEAIERHRQEVERDVRALFGLMAAITTSSSASNTPAPSAPSRDIQARLARAKTLLMGGREQRKEEAGREKLPPGEHAVLTGPEQRILNAIAWLEDIGVAAPEQTAVAFLAGYTYGGGAFNNPRGALRTKGLVDYAPGDRIQLTDAGRVVAQHQDTALTPQDLHARVLARLPGPEQRLLRPLLAAYPSPLSNEALAAAAGYTPNAGAFNNPRGRLRTLGLIDYPKPGFVMARPVLFLE